MERADQEIRAAAFADASRSPDAETFARLAAEDARRLARLKEIVAEIGWPRANAVGPDAAHAAWILAQHADTDPDFQEWVLAEITPLVATGEVDGDDFALLTDRVRANRGKPQVYGSQYRFWRDASGLHVEPTTPIEDPERLDERRARLGLVPHERYLELLREYYRLDPVPGESEK